MNSQDDQFRNKEIEYPLTLVDETLLLDGKQLLWVNDSNAALLAALTGLGILSTYEFLAREHLLSGALVPVLPHWSSEALPVHIAFSSNKNMARKTRAFVDWTVEIFNDFLKTSKAGFF
ncbi:LysR substrate-binding domain-containing protein [Undibacterium sp. TC4M20W]|uniref:LysR substrate-binding domain-containing protein n=1 Tax=unclassified Undibacterium TaxID=2630295 RepID=UPI003BEF5DE9